MPKKTSTANPYGYVPMANTDRVSQHDRSKSRAPAVGALWKVNRPPGMSVH
ncbi:hypothetical protein [Streptomyces chryseus]